MAPQRYERVSNNLLLKGPHHSLSLRALKHT